MSRTLRFAALSLAASFALITACDSGTETPSGPGPVASVTIAPASASVAVGETQQLIATARDAGGTQVSATFTWSSSDGSLASVDANGLVTGVAEGTATITATTGGISGTAAVAVTPPPVATVEVDPTAATLNVGETVQLTATPKDASGAVVATGVNWTSSDAAVASVDSDGLVTANGSGQATISATADGQSGSAAIDVLAAPFNPTGDTDLSGNPKFADVMIPAGVTVTATGDLDLRSAGDVTIAGTLTGECVQLSLRGDANVTITGTVSNGCTQGQTTTPDLTIESTGDLDLDGGTVESGGSVLIRNDPTLSESDFDGAAPAPSLGAASARMGSCTARNFAFVPMPSQAMSGTDGQMGTDGENGRTWRLLCRGDAKLAGGVRVFGQDGGPGGRGMHQSNTAASAKGGNGGTGGLIRLLATGTWTFEGSGNEAIGGDGGSGGYAEANGQFNPALEPRAASASATSGNGGDAGLVEIRSLSSITVNPGALTIRVGDGGFASNARAIGAHGAHADERNNLPAQPGGNAIAIGGLGGDSPDKMLQATGSITGENNVTVEGGNGGEGGKSEADAGDGGNGNQAFPDGAPGGDIDDAANNLVGAEGGQGGDALTKNAAGTIVGLGGVGGAVEVTGGIGGVGFNGCSVSPVVNGGNGGDGGLITSLDGRGGTGQGGMRAASGGTTATGPLGNGGEGGNGEPTPGIGGIGTLGDGIQSNGPRTNTQPQFKDGADGMDCHSGTYSVSVSVKSDPGGHNPFIGLGSLIQLSILLEQFSADGSVIIVSGGFPFVTVTGTRDTQGIVDAIGQGTVAGFSNVQITLVGQLNCDATFDFDYTMGAGGELPGGQPITYNITGSMGSAGVKALGLRRARLDGAGGAAAVGGCG